MSAIAPSHVHPMHPLRTQEYAIFTPPVNEMVTTLGDWIEQRQPGGYIYGPSRFGKSRGVKWFLRSILNERFGAEIPVHVWIRVEDVQRSESRFWKSWLQALIDAMDKTP